MTKFKLKLKVAPSLAFPAHAHFSGSRLTQKRHKRNEREEMGRKQRRRAPIIAGKLINFITFVTAAQFFEVVETMNNFTSFS